MKKLFLLILCIFLMASCEKNFSSQKQPQEEGSEKSKKVHLNFEKVTKTIEELRLELFSILPKLKNAEKDFLERINRMSNKEYHDYKKDRVVPKMRKGMSDLQRHGEKVSSGSHIAFAANFKEAFGKAYMIHYTQKKMNIWFYAHVGEYYDFQLVNETGREETWFLVIPFEYNDLVQEFLDEASEDLIMAFQLRLDLCYLFLDQKEKVHYSFLKEITIKYAHLSYEHTK